jgi:D-sedoheptulose 7-phosphate isomerase
MRGCKRGDLQHRSQNNIFLLYRLQRQNKAAETMIKSLLETSAEVKKQTAEQCSQDAEAAARLIAESLAAGGKLMLCGNGGSAADSQHLAAEFVATLDHTKPRPGLAALALTTDTSLLTAWSNDFGFQGVFARQIEALGQPADILLALSTSGNSKNIVEAVTTAQKMAVKTIVMTGAGGGQLAGLADIVIRVPSQTVMHIQEAHIALGHAITARAEQLLANRG